MGLATVEEGQIGVDIAAGGTAVDELAESLEGFFVEALIVELEPLLKNVAAAHA